MRVAAITALFPKNPEGLPSLPSSALCGKGIGEGPPARRLTLPLLQARVVELSCRQRRVMRVAAITALFPKNPEGLPSLPSSALCGFN